MEGSCSNVELSTRTSLRPLNVSDIDDFMVWASDEKVAHLNTWEAYTNKEDDDFMLSLTPGSRQSALDNKPIGSTTVCTKAGNESCGGELSYALAIKYWDKGIATRAVRIVVDTIFKEWRHLERLEALVDVDNVGSQRVLEKVGFRKEGVLRKYVAVKGRTCDMVMYSLLPSDQ